VGDPDNIYSYAAIQKAMRQEKSAGLPVDIGVDVARSGDDETVIVLREGLRVRIHNQAQGHDTMRTTGEIWRCCQDKIIPKWKDRLDRITIKVDADGVGGGVVDRLKEQRREKENLYTAAIFGMLSKERVEELEKKEYRLRIKIVEIHGSGKPKDPVHFKNVRAEIHWGLRELLEDLDLPNDREVSSQLIALKHKTNSAGQIMIIPKEEVKEKLGRSPDLAEAIIYALADIKPVKEPRIW
jgi:phage terminase large subunit